MTCGKVWIINKSLALLPNPFGGIVFLSFPLRNVSQLCTLVFPVFISPACANACACARTSAPARNAPLCGRGFGFSPEVSRLRGAGPLCVIPQTHSKFWQTLIFFVNLQSEKER